MLTINDNTGLAQVYGMHEGSGPVHYKRLINGGMLDGQIQGMDFASVPPGSVIGQHDHTDTSEMWVVLDGRGDVELEGTVEVMRAGDVLYTPVGGRHSMTNPLDATAPVDFLVVTMTSSAEAPSGGRRSEVKQLAFESVEFAGLGDDRYEVTMSGLDAGGQAIFDAAASQHLVYVVHGAATLSWGSVRRELAHGSVVGIPAAERVELTAHESLGCRMLTVRIDHASFRVSAPDSGLQTPDRETA